MTVLYFVVIPPPFKAVDNKITRFERDTEEDGEQPRHPVQDTKRRQLVFETPVMVVSFDCFSKESSRWSDAVLTSSRLSKMASVSPTFLRMVFIGVKLNSLALGVSDLCYRLRSIDH